MNSTRAAPLPLGLVVNRFVAERVAALADEYGSACASLDNDAGHRRRLGVLLLGALRSLRLDAVAGSRFRVVRSGGRLEVQALARRDP